MSPKDSAQLRPPVQVASSSWTRRAEYVPGRRGQERPRDHHVAPPRVSARVFSTSRTDTPRWISAMPGPGRSVAMAGHAQQMGRLFRLASPGRSLVKIMRITGLDRRFLGPQAPGRLSP